MLERLDLVFSRDGHAQRYVQDALHAHAGTLRAWVDEGAALYVCGSLEGMAPGVDAALNEILGQSRMTALADAGRYRRDVYGCVDRTDARLSSPRVPVDAAGSVDS